MMRKKLLTTDFYLLKIFVEPRVLFSTAMSIILLLISTFFFGDKFQKSLKQIKSYSHSNFRIIEKTSNTDFDNQLFDLSNYARFYIESKPGKIFRFETYLKIDRFNYSMNIISGTSINDLKNNEILISQNIAEYYDLKIGDVIKGDNDLFSKNKITYQIIGIFDNFYGIKEYPSDYQGVVIVGDYPSYTKNSLFYTYFNKSINQSYGDFPVTVYQLIESAQKYAIENFIILVIFSFIGNISWIEIIFFTSFNFLKLVKKSGGSGYKKLLKLLHIFEIGIFASLYIIIAIITNLKLIITIQFIIFIFQNLFCYIFNLNILKKREV